LLKNKLRDTDMSGTLKVLNDTYFKVNPVQSSELEDSQKVLILKNTEFEVHSYILAENNHIKVALANAVLGVENKNTWFTFAPHIKIEEKQQDNASKENPNPDLIKVSGQKQGEFKLPGFTSNFYLSEPIIAGGHFSWAEATKDGTRIPTDKDIVKNIIKIASVMEEVRNLFGDRSITVTSWYRDPENNRKAKGAKQSRHLVGDAVDFTVQGVSPSEVHRRVEPWWGNRGGIASASCFTHIDARGSYARWKYNF
jgi:hypothetical protein